eukprot:Selendium_serpulae@DN6427_c1_g1_i5.p1
MKHRQKTGKMNNSVNSVDREPEAREIGEYVKCLMHTPPDCSGCSSSWLQFIEKAMNRDSECHKVLPITTLIASTVGRKPHHLPLWRPEGHYNGCSREPNYGDSISEPPSPGRDEMAFALGEGLNIVPFVSAGAISTMIRRCNSVPRWIEPARGDVVPAGDTPRWIAPASGDVDDPVEVEEEEEEDEKDETDEEILADKNQQQKEADAAAAIAKEKLEAAARAEWFKHHPEMEKFIAQTLVEVDRVVVDQADEADEMEFERFAADIAFERKRRENMITVYGLRLLAKAQADRAQPLDGSINTPEAEHSEGANIASEPSLESTEISSESSSSSESPILPVASSERLRTASEIALADGNKILPVSSSTGKYCDEPSHVLCVDT